MAYDPIKNYEATNITEELNGELIVLANGKTVIVTKTGGLTRLRATFQAHFFTFHEGFIEMGDTFTYHGVEFVVESISFNGLTKIRDDQGRYWDERTYEMSCVSTKAYDNAELVINQRKAGEADG
jgi:hypothetical protein